MDPTPTPSGVASKAEVAAAKAEGLPLTSPRRWAGHFRWVICALLFFGVTKNYMDRQVLGLLKTTLQHDLGWNEIDYSNVVLAFQAAYAVGMLAGKTPASPSPSADRATTKQWNEPQNACPIEARLQKTMATA